MRLVFMNRYWVLFIILFCELYHTVRACLDSKQPARKLPIPPLVLNRWKNGKCAILFFQFPELRFGLHWLICLLCINTYSLLISCFAVHVCRFSSLWKRLIVIIFEWCCLSGDYTSSSLYQIRSCTSQKQLKTFICCASCNAFLFS